MDEPIKLNKLRLTVNQLNKNDESLGLSKVHGFNLQTGEIEIFLKPGCEKLVFRGRDDKDSVVYRAEVEVNWI